MFPGDYVRRQNTVLYPPAPRIYQKRIEIQEGCVFLDAESDGTIYFSLSAEMTKIRAIFHLCGWFETTPEGGKSPITPSFLQIDQNKWYYPIKCTSSD